jgi:hypothetical protein
MMAAMESLGNEASCTGSEYNHAVRCLQMVSDVRGETVPNEEVLPLANMMVQAVMAAKASEKLKGTCLFVRLQELCPVPL